MAVAPRCRWGRRCGSVLMRSWWSPRGGFTRTRAAPYSRSSTATPHSSKGSPSTKPSSMSGRASRSSVMAGRSRSGSRTPFAKRSVLGPPRASRLASSSQRSRAIFEKPDGLVVVLDGEARAFLAPLPIERMWGIGPKTAPHLRALGYRTLGDLAQAPAADLERHLGVWGTQVRLLARGEDSRDVEPHVDAKTIGAEETFEHDLTTREEVSRALLDQSGRVAQRLLAEGYSARDCRREGEARRLHSPIAPSSTRRTGVRHAVDPSCCGGHARSLRSPRRPISLEADWDRRGASFGGSAAEAPFQRRPRARPQAGRGRSGHRWQVRRCLFAARDAAREAAESHIQCVRFYPPVASARAMIAGTCVRA